VKTAAIGDLVLLVLGLAGVYGLAHLQRLQVVEQALHVGLVGSRVVRTNHAPLLALLGELEFLAGAAVFAGLGDHDLVDRLDVLVADRDLGERSRLSAQRVSRLLFLVLLVDQEERAAKDRQDRNRAVQPFVGIACHVRRSSAA
jgi:hypothetical protein